MIENLLKDKNILLGITGSISAYKALELIRLYVKAGANVKVVMSEASQKFITTLSVETLSKNRVLIESNEDWTTDNNHIKVTQWADLFVIAPCSANTIAKLANAIADNLLLQCALAYSKLKLIAPAANTNMLNHPITQANLKLLGVTNHKIIQTQTKELACESVGDGALAEPLEIFYQSASELLKDEFWSNRRVIVSGGGSIEKIDDVRFVSNFSSGKMASSIALALHLRGADVNFISSKFPDTLPKDLHTLHVESSLEMMGYLQDSIRIAKKGVMKNVTLTNELHQPQLIQKEPFLFMVAAVSDYVPTFPQSGKLKKEMLGENYSLEMKQNIDIVGSLNKDGIKTVSFKAEFEEATAFENAKKSLSQKGVDGVCLNILNNNSFGSETNEIELILKEKSIKLTPNKKLPLAFELLHVIGKEFE
ncbi:MAG: bifunctional phosphopantothenoylcysteine decarboxylase/phosphopantothenate--cysteine ligase CoaBC [Campylobacterota bacterium]|nr:bifunctional phosphopantothenoylcysteine decarboxylase/phosphopantothenate--cysteine ligase CoaBC [Campylobacterota bacterium]